MTRGPVRHLLAVGLLLVLATAARPALGQQVEASAPAGSPFVPSDASLDRIRMALASEPALTLADTHFHVEVIAKAPTFADYLKGSDLRAHVAPPMPPGMGYGSGFAVGIDLGQLFGFAVERLGNAQHQRKVRRIRERIDRELQALVARRDAPPAR